MRSRFLLAALVWSLSAPSLLAQIEYGGEPPSQWLKTLKAPPTVELPPVDVQVYLLEDLELPPTMLRFGAPIDVHQSIDEIGSWEQLPDGSRMWRVRLHAPHAYSLHVLFDRFVIPDGAELYVYNDDRSMVLGQYNALNVKPNGEFMFQPVEGEAITLEYVEPAWVDFPGEITIGQVFYGYRNVFVYWKSGRRGGTKAACETDVNCPQGDPWRDQINATLQIIANGALCTGSMLNNTNFDGDQLFITASHCGNLNNAVFRFNYQKSGCGTGTAPTNQTVQGSTQLAVNTSIDFRLVRIIPTIPSSYGHYLAGWDRSGQTPSNTVCVHHPQGGPKKISFDNDPPGKSGTDWHIFQWDLGVTEPGSSGSPLYDPNGRFIGQLWGGAAACGYPYDDYFGRLQAEWSYVAPYLDPAGTGATAIDGLDPNCPAPVVYGQGSVGSTGQVGTTLWTGTPSLAAGNFAITASGFRPNSFAVLLTGTKAVNVQKPWGTLYVGGFTTRTLFTTDANGQATIPIVITPSMVGTTDYFENIVRDPGFGGNLQHGNGLQVTYCP